jgi:hypothetical protein
VLLKKKTVNPVYPSNEKRGCKQELVEEIWRQKKKFVVFGVLPVSCHAAGA